MEPELLERLRPLLAHLRDVGNYVDANLIHDMAYHLQQLGVDTASKVDIAKREFNKNKA